MKQRGPKRITSHQRAKRQSFVATLSAMGRTPPEIVQAISENLAEFGYPITEAQVRKDRLTFQRSARKLSDPGYMLEAQRAVDDCIEHG